MKTELFLRLLIAGAGSAYVAGAASFPLEWNVTYRTDVPYEVELDTGKLGAESFSVSADGRPLETRHFAGKKPGTVALRFNVPHGTRSLMCETRDGSAALSDTVKIDNIFADALDPENIGRWTLGEGVKAEAMSGGIRFRSTGTEPGTRYVAYTVDLPDGMAGKPVIQEMALRNMTRLAWGGDAFIRQLDASGAVLPETVADLRWTTHMRPSRKLSEYRDEGHIHPRAKKLRVELELRTLDVVHDEYGLKLKDLSERQPVLEVTRIAVRPAERLPFPKWNDSFFTGGVSGKPGDTAMRFGGKEGKAMFYQLTSRGSWTARLQFTNETDRYFPSGAGTVEAWFRPDGAASGIRKGKADGMRHPVVLFEAYQGFSAATRKPGAGPVLRLSYLSEEKKLSLLIKDWKGHEYGQTWTGDGFEIPEERWTHVAVQWMPKGEAQIYLNGRKAAGLPIPEFEALPLDDADLKNVNDLWALEFFLGSSCASVRLSEKIREEFPLFEGAADNLRVSTGCRYDGPFEPAKEFTLDAGTRALFTFDRAFNGVSGGGFGFIPASVRALADRVDHRLAVDGVPLQYYPEEILPENDPRKIFDPLNYPVMPRPEEYRAARRTFTKRAKLSPGEKLAVKCGDVAYPEWVEFRNPSRTERLMYPVLVNAGRPDPRSFGDMAESFAFGDAPDREKVNRIFRYLLSSTDYFMNHQVSFPAGTDVPRSSCYDALLMLNGYCGFECGPMNHLTANLFSAVAACPASQTGGYRHSFEQVFFDGKNHLYDLSFRKYFPAMDNETPAYLKEAGDQPAILNRMGESAERFIRKSLRAHVALDPSYQEKFAMTLNPGERFRVWYANNGRMNNLQTRRRSGIYGMKKLSPDRYDYADAAGADDKSFWVIRMDRIFPHYSTGTISFDGVPAAGSPALEQVKPDSFCYRVRSCYPVVWGEYAAFGKDGKPVGLELSTDSGRTFRPVPRGADGVSRLEYMVKGRHDYLVRIKAPLASVKRLVMRTDCEVNTRTYPGWVAPGENGLVFKAEPGPEAEVAVAWSEPEKDIVISGGAYSGTIPGRERQLALLDPSLPLELEVSGASPTAEVRCQGRVKAHLGNGKLVLSYDPSRPLAMRRGDDLECWYAGGTPDVPQRREFPSVAGVEICDGGAVKRLAVIVSPDARLAFAESARLKGGAVLKPADGDSVQPRVRLSSTEDTATFGYPELPAGRYCVFALARFAGQPEDESCCVHIVNPDPAGKEEEKSFPVARYINGATDYLKVHVGRKGGRSRWKWDTANLTGREYGQTDFFAWSIRPVTFPRSGHVELELSGVSAEGVEVAAVLILPEPDLECRNDLRKTLFGMNCDPFLVR